MYIHKTLYYSVLDIFWTDLILFSFGLVSFELSNASNIHLAFLILLIAW